MVEKVRNVFKLFLDKEMSKKYFGGRRVYDVVKYILQTDMICRDNDKILMYKVWDEQGLFHGYSMTSLDFISSAVAPETIRRTRQMIQAKFPYLRAEKKIQKAREELAKQKGTHVFRAIFNYFNRDKHVRQKFIIYIRGARDRYVTTCL